MSPYAEWRSGQGRGASAHVSDTPQPLAFQLLTLAALKIGAELVYLHEITDGFQAKRIIDNWIEFYNSERPHTALDKRTPDIAYVYQAETQKAA